MPKTIKQLHQVKLSSAHLQLGMYVCELDRDWLETPFLFQGFLISDPDDLLALKSICEFVYIDLHKTRALNLDLHALANTTQRSEAVYQVSTSIETEIKTANTSYRNAFFEVKTMLQHVFEGEGFSTGNMVVAVRSCLDSILRNPSALLWLTRIKHVDQYTAEHCLNVGIEAMALGRHLGLGRKHIELLGLCGMLHDVGKMSVDQSILNKAGKLTANEFEHIKKHVIFGRDKLNEDSEMPPQVANVAYSHHERLDGQGYPRGLPAHRLDFYTRVITIVDAYDAITSVRCYSSSNSSAEALRILYANRSAQFDEKLVVKFIECIGIYPPGALVEMNTGEVGVVLSVDPLKRLLPKVALVRDADKGHMEQLIVDLAAEPLENGTRKYWVAKVLVDGSHGVDLEDFTIHNVRLSDGAS
ncbi:MAG TPA: HD-GYP domain-containing protein [Pseudomonas xinjiangensis]|uniref:HD-GYP domain-containing protein n=2 Tax=root TaxID=1 RepID=A0A7V1FR25_9GAMM|nr:HD-GYP domain-containing protein [Halopseudomonas xinjiangensis]HEC49183.1 HD-GYP domain-containing protein [Halopseudomonas xinjiangensis]